MDKFARYHDAVNYLEGLLNVPATADYMAGKVHAEIYIKRLRYFLELVGNPERGMKFVHVAGTAGKGTVVTMIKEMLATAGYKVGCDTSPFVTTSIEKIQVGNKYIAPYEFADIVDYLKPFLDKAHVESPYGMPSYFETFMVITFIYFKQKKCDWAVIETGLGGRYDASNVIQKPAVTVITNIDYDHTNILGKTLTKIARDKAGIIKSGSTFFTTEQRPRILKLFQNICDDKKVKLTHITAQKDVTELNANLVRAIGQQLCLIEKHIEQGIKNTKLPARFEVMQQNPLIILDGAHNRAKIRHTLTNLKKLRYKKLHLVIGMSEDKDHEQILSEFIPCADHVYVTRFKIKVRRCAAPKYLLEIGKKYLKVGARAEVFLDAGQALAEAGKKAKKEDAILVTGSFFLAGELREFWYSEEHVLDKRSSF
jgi:dihydrofolate synthase/folylpolyglutamate synthase